MADRYNTLCPCDSLSANFLAIYAVAGKGLETIEAHMDRPKMIKLSIMRHMCCSMTKPRVFI